MPDSLARIAAIIRADFLVRFRRVSTLVVFLLLCGFAYLWIPDSSTGRTLIQLDGQRAIYNSGAIGVGTASVGMMFVGLFGFYVISNAIRRDIVTRCGVIAASTPMRSIEYLLGKFFGNLVFLSTFLAGFMLSSMAMQIVRGEAPLEPLVFLEQYLLLTPAAIVFVSAVAVLFESIPFLSGKIGDVFYFFFWMTFLGLVVGDQVSGNKMSWARCLDFSGFGFMIDQMTRILHTNEVSIGASAFDPTKAPIIFPGLRWTAEWAAPRIISLLIPPLVFLPLAGLFFHRFDPVRTRKTADKSQRRWLGKIQSLFKPLSRGVTGALMPLARGQSFLGAIWVDAILTFTLIPFVPVIFLAITVASVVGVQPRALLPIVFAVLAIVIAETATRDRRAATIPILYSAPRLRERFVWWKAGSVFLLSLILCAAPILRALILAPHSLAPLLIGLLFVSTMSTSLGLMAGNSKAFIAAFLCFWYLVVNDKGATTGLDFAGFYGTASTRTMLLYFALSLASLAAAEIFHRARLARA